MYKFTDLTIGIEEERHLSNELYSTTELHAAPKLRKKIVLTFQALQI